MKTKKEDKTKATKKEKEPKREAIAKADTAVYAEPKPRTFQELALSVIQVNPLNPRKNFSGPKYDEILASIRRKGVIVPVLVRPLPDGVYELIAGERRYRAASEAAKGNGGIEKARIPAIIQEMTDEEAYDCMMIENLQRADLTPLEEARAFKLYLDRKGPEALPDLAERVGINPCYIRRRTAVLDLSEKILKAWEEGKLSYGHLEQLVRVSDSKERNELFDHTMSYGWNVKHLKDNIESRTPKLSSALFDKDAAGCLACPKNTDVQRNLFGEDMATKSLCLDPDCYLKHQTEWIQANWSKFKSSRKLDTNGVLIQDTFRYDEYHGIYNEGLEKCKSCENYLSIITVDGKIHDKEACFGPKKCHDELYYPHSAAAKKAADPNAPRVCWHGEFFREEFYKARIPELMTALPADDDKVLRITLLTILEMNHDAMEFFDAKCNFKRGERYYSDHSKQSWPLIQKLETTELRSILQELSLLILMQSDTTSAATRRTVAVHLGSDLAKEWRLTQEYLDKKTTKEIHAIAAKFKLFELEKAKIYLYEKLLKKRDRFDTCKKGELVKVILESGIDLARVVPDEILSQ